MPDTFGPVTGPDCIHDDNVIWMLHGAGSVVSQHLSFLDICWIIWSSQTIRDHSTAVLPYYEFCVFKKS